MEKCRKCGDTGIGKYGEDCICIVSKKEDIKIKAKQKYIDSSCKKCGGTGYGKYGTSDNCICVTYK